jgi:RNA polymerase sigma-70 factor (ECF subfamily)
VATNGLHPADTESLLRRLQSGDAKALDRLFTQHRPYLRRVVELRLDPKLRARVDASDVVQETELEVARRIDDYLRRQPMSFRLWLRKTAKERVLMVHRRHLQACRRAAGREVPLPEGSSIALAQQLLAGGPSPSRAARRRDTARQVRQAVGALDEADHEIILMRNFEELTNQEVAEALAIAPAAASKRYGRALLRLKDVLIERGLSGSDP